MSGVLPEVSAKRKAASMEMRSFALTNKYWLRGSERLGLAESLVSTAFGSLVGRLLVDAISFFIAGMQLFGIYPLLPTIVRENANSPGIIPGS